MRVLFVFSTGKLEGSAAAVWMNLLRGLPSRGVEPFVVMPESPDAGFLSGLGKLGIPWEHVRFRWWATSGAKPTSFTRRVTRRRARILNSRAEGDLGKIIEERGIELVYICDGTITTGLEAAKKRGIPVVWHIHEFIRSQEDDTDFLDPGMHVGNTLIKADRIITVTKSIRTDLVQRFPGLREVGIKTIYNGVLKSRTFDKDGILGRDDRVVFSLVGRICENKGQLEAVRAFSGVAAEFPQARLRLVGRGSEHDIRRLSAAAARAGVGDRVEFQEGIGDVARVWEDTDVVLNCSYSEGCSMPLCEALTSGCLALCSTAESNVEIVDGKYGLLYPRRKADALAHKMRWVLKHQDEARKIAAVGKEHALVTFDLDRQLDAVYGVFEEAMG